MEIRRHGDSSTRTPYGNFPYYAIYQPLHTTQARYDQICVKAPLNPNQPTNRDTLVFDIFRYTFTLHIAQLRA